MAPSSTIEPPQNSVSRTSADLLKAVDRSARQRAVLLAYGRRQAGYSNPASLIDEAGELMAEALEVPWFGAYIPHAGGLKLSLRGTTRGPQDKAEDLQHLYPAGMDCLAVGALRLGQPVVVADLPSDTRLKDRYVQERGLSGALVVPLSIGSEIYGALAMLSEGPHPLSATDLEFAENLGHLLSATIARLQSDARLCMERAALSAVLATKGLLVVELDPAGNIVRLNEQCEQTSGFATSEVQGRPLKSTLVPPEQFEQVGSAIQAALTAESPLILPLELLGKRGERRSIQVSLTRALDSQGRVGRLVMSGLVTGESSSLRDEVEHQRTLIERLQQGLTALKNKQVPERTSEASVSSSLPDLNPSGAYETAEQRLFPYRQMMAPLRTGELPTSDQFQPVQCRDITARGLSFVSPNKPEYDAVVFALGSGQSLRYIAAQIDGLSTASLGDWQGWVVSCRFTQRVAL